MDEAGQGVVEYELQSQFAIFGTQEEVRTVKKRLARERLTIGKMIGIYCSAHHGSSGSMLCADCAEFQDYAELRLRKCPYGEDKPTCSNCPIHCYKPAQKAQARMIMRYAGPRMMFRHPLLAICHKIDGLRKVGHPSELTREQRLHSKNT
jgi:hypothetical protein